MKARLDRIKDVFTDTLATSREDLDMAAVLETDLAVDSLDRVELAMGIEDEFDTNIADEEMWNWRTVQDVVNTVEKLMAA